MYKVAYYTQHLIHVDQSDVTARLPYFDPLGLCVFIFKPAAPRVSYLVTNSARGRCHGDRSQSSVFGRAPSWSDVVCYICRPLHYSPLVNRTGGFDVLPDLVMRAYVGDVVFDAASGSMFNLNAGFNRSTVMFAHLLRSCIV